ncbi:3-methyladenine DNA glycosylase [Corynebacterium yudongzhengii]|uniref:DNA-3-methyladenine glycosylase I n=1 Tax=Corynebacterium yudongzhengii TaxID=2080740 RepID=A0A2U1T7Y9_9CORY|nr:DNA-3-methyladenine glycosylase I [Corynebacterium yudongzhengii]AWB82296.1 3-methyladenine DNA glycosylase [Corynebacterium yudongzhengii]PWC02085.1 DNA-3-methyladenine glycosylase I [Corynebacterium yudongzhengii]
MGENTTESTESTTATGVIIGEDGLARPPWAARDELLRYYYDTEWGMPVYDDQSVFERLCLEGFQAGLSWRTILAKREAFREAFAHFDIDTVARFGEDDVARLLDNPEIIRNEKKIRAAITNARATLQLQKEGTSLADIVWSYQPEENYYPTTVDEIPSSSEESKALAKELKSYGFTFVGPTIMFALMEAIGVIDTHLMDSHRRGSSGVWDDAEAAG